MDFLDPIKERRSRLKLVFGYCLVALAIGIATLVLLYQSFGYGLDKQGNVTQNGLVFLSSHPTNAAIYLNGVRYKSNTDTRVVVPGDNYNVQVSLAGYRTWSRTITVNGGDVQHFDYPFLFPATLHSAPLSQLVASPSVGTQSLDHRWLLLGRSDASGVFTLYDFKAPDKPVDTTVSLPDSVFTPGDSTGAQTWSAVEWAADNRHVLLQHSYTQKSTAGVEYILLDRDSPVASVNLTASLHLTAGETLTLFNNRISQFYVFNQAAQTLERINGSDGTVVSKLEHVLAYKAYSDDKVLYITDLPPTGKTVPNTVSAVLQDGQKAITLRTLPAGASAYSLTLAQYSGDWYVVVGSSNSTAAYVYKNPQSQPTQTTDTYPAAWRRLPVPNPSYSAFSSNTQFLLVENGQDFVVFDFENALLYRYHVAEPLDQPQLHASWMDGDRLTYVSGGKLQVFDYDYHNHQTLLTANPAYLPAFSPDYKYLYTLQTPSADGKATLLSTPLTVKQ